MSKQTFRAISVKPADIDVFAACIAQIAYQMNEALDEVECFEMARDQLRKGEMSYMDAVELGICFKATLFHEAKNRWS